MADQYLVISEGIGSRKRSVKQHFGPASYTQMTTGPVAGGDIVTAKSLGLKTIESCNLSDAADDGIHGVIAVLVGKEPIQVTLAWYTDFTFATQVVGTTNLSALSVRVEATGL